MAEDETIQQFETLGLPTVRLMLASSRWNHENEMKAIKWVAQKEEEELSRNDLSSEAQIRVALSAKRAAWVAAIAAIIAAIVAIAGAIITYLAWLYPHAPN